MREGKDLLQRKKVNFYLYFIKQYNSGGNKMKQLRVWGIVIFLITALILIMKIWEHLDADRIMHPDTFEAGQLELMY